MDRLPPYDAAAEMATIGACVTDPAECIPQAGLVIKTPEMFYDLRCQLAWKAMVEMNPSEVNIVTVCGRLRFENPHSFLIECQNDNFSSANLPSWLAVIQDKYTLRKIIQTCSSAVSDAFESKDSIKTLDRIERDILKIRPSGAAESDIKSILNEAVEIIEFKAKNRGSISGLSTGLVDLDEKTDGMHGGEMIVIAAFPSCGKTALMVNIAIHNALKGIPVGILSAEMLPVQLVIRSICSESRVNFKHISERDVAAMIPQMKRLASAPIYIAQATGWTIGQAQAQARRWYQSYGIKMLGADYIQKFTGNGDGREQEIASIGAGFKDISMELGIPVLALSQLNDDGRLRESRALGMDGDSIWKLKNDGEWKRDVQPIKLAIEKCRNGETGEIDLTFLKTITRFESRSKIEPNNEP